MRVSRLSEAGGRRVLVIDDDESMLDAFARTLRLEGYQVQTASTTAAAFDRIDAFRPEAILLDLRMPGADGAEFLRGLRAKEKARRIPVAVITGDHTIDDAFVSELQALGADLHFKPIWLVDLVRITETLLARAP